MGGNQWAGGTGGRDTAGLGGVGGPYRLDAGHDVHQARNRLRALSICTMLPARFSPSVLLQGSATDLAHPFTQKFLGVVK